MNGNYSDWTTRSWIAELECSLCFLFIPSLKNVSFAGDDGFGKKKTNLKLPPQKSN